MANIILENLSDDLIQKIEQLAQQHHQSLSKEIIFILKQAVEKPQAPLKFVISPETDPTWAERKTPSYSENLSRD